MASPGGRGRKALIVRRSPGRPTLAHAGSTGVVRLAKLAVLAAASVDGRMNDPRIASRLAVDAGRRARHRASARLRNVFAAFDAFERAFTRGHTRPGVQHAIGYRIVDLIEDSAVPCPPSGHVSSPFPNPAP